MKISSVLLRGIPFLQTLCLIHLFQFSRIRQPQIQFKSIQIFSKSFVVSMWMCSKCCLLTILILTLSIRLLLACVKVFGLWLTNLTIILSPATIPSENQKMSASDHSSELRLIKKPHLAGFRTPLVLIYFLECTLRLSMPCQDLKMISFALLSTIAIENFPSIQ